MVKIVSNIFTNSTNKTILKHLGELPFYIAKDHGSRSRIDAVFEKNNHGFSHSTWLHRKGGETYKTPLNLYADIIFEKVVDELKLGKVALNRIFWNMYFKNSETELHQDISKELPNAYSIVYSIHDSGGGLIINNKFIKDVPGEAKIFKSNSFHKGTGPKKTNVRFSLNILYEEVNS
mgnify:FL=1|tara:strand:- start:127 stop:657 length:531 start_codon:yes stop_codon:yes gene_type:complete